MHLPTVAKEAIPEYRGARHRRISGNRETNRDANQLLLPARVPLCSIPAGKYGVRMNEGE